MRPSSPRSFSVLLLITVMCTDLTPSIVLAEEPKNVDVNTTSRIAVVTGGNKGIGYAIVKGLCEQFDGIVYLTARNEKRGQATIEKLNKAGFYPRFHQLDVTEDASVEEFKNYLNNTHGGLDILVNNAGIAYLDNTTEPISTQASEIVPVNYFGVLRVSKALFPLLKPHARVVHLSSILGHLSNIPGDALKARFLQPELTEDGLSQLMRQFVETTKTGTHQTFGWSNNSYAVSKVGVTALARVQQREFDRDDRENLVVNAVHPGFVNTDMTLYQAYFTIERGAQAPLYAALLPTNTEIKGEYIWHDKTLVDWVNGTFPTPYQNFTLHTILNLFVDFC